MKIRATTEVRKVGGSLGVIIPLPIWRAHGIDRGDELQIAHGEHGTIVLQKINTIT